MKRLLELTQDTRLPLLLTALAGFLGGLLIIWQASEMSWVINRVFLMQKTLPDVLPGLKLLLLIFVGRAILSWGGEVSAKSIATHIKHDLRVRLYSHISQLGPAYLWREKTGELVSTSIEGIEALDAYYSEYLPQLLVSAIVPFTILVVIFPLDPISALVLLLTAPLIPLFMVLIGRGAEALTKRQYESLGKLSAYFLDSLQGLTTLKQFGRSKAHTRNISVASDRYRDVTLQVLRITFLSAFTLELLSTLSVAIIAVEIGLRLLYGHMAFQDAIFLLILAPEFYMPLRLLGQRFHAGVSGTTAAERIFQILDTGLPSNTGLMTETAQTGKAPNHPSATLAFSHVTYTFPGEKQPALNDVTMSIPLGKRIALVGPSGGGKSTIANLLMRFDEPDSGQIHLDGKLLTEIPIDGWREMLAWVPQAPYLFHDTVEANICLANPRADHDLIVQAAQAAHLHEFIVSLPENYKTIIGEGGARLSGGQGQRIAFARAFLKDAPILILDEPTSGLDPEQERLLDDSLNRLMQAREDRTIITIAHRLNTIISADQIVVIDKGRLLEMGNHKELLDLDGAYAGLFSALSQESETRLDKVISVDGQDGGQIEAYAGSGGRYLADKELDMVPTFSSLHQLTRLLGFLKGSWGRILLSVALGAATIFASIGLMGTSAYLISAAALHPSISTLEIAIVGVRFFGISRGVFRYLERLVSHDVTLRILGRLRTWFFEALEPLAPARLMHFHSGDLLSRIVTDVDNLENFYVRAVSPPMVALIVAMTTSLFLGSIAPGLGLSAALFLVLLGLGVPILTRVMSNRASIGLIDLRADLANLLVDGIQGLPDLTALGRVPEYQQQIAALSQETGAAQRSLARVGGLNNAFSLLLANLGMWSVLWMGIRLVTLGEINGVILASLAMLTLASFEAVTPLPRAGEMLSSCLESAARLFAIVDTNPAVSENPEPALSTQRQSAVPQALHWNGLELRELGFSYGPDDSPALKGINLNLAPGRALAIVGPSGAGKSTLFNIFQRFWDFQQGNYLVGGRLVQTFPVEDVRRLFAVVSQNPYFFNASVRENLLLGNPKASREQLEFAAKRAQVHETILALPTGYETSIGERGVRLSGGERQRLAVARALLRESPVLLLDEPTANLDALTARAFLDILFDLMREGERSTLLITHRLWGLDNFDEILVLYGGSIIERGIHSDLLRGGGLYRRLWEQQNMAGWI